MDITEIRGNLHNLSIPLYVNNGSSEDDQDLESTIEAWQVGRVELKKQSKKLFAALKEKNVQNMVKNCSNYLPIT